MTLTNMFSYVEHLFLQVSCLICSKSARETESDEFRQGVSVLMTLTNMFSYVEHLFLQVSLLFVRVLINSRTHEYSRNNFFVYFWRNEIKLVVQPREALYEGIEEF